MSTEWRKVTDLFTAALEVRPEARSDFLADACDGDPELLTEVESLLRSHTDSADFLKDSAVMEVADRVIADGTLEKGSSIAGQYEIESLIGSGGMGDVYLARDTRLNRKVAIKLLPFASADNLDRVLNEAQIVSALNHPNILTLHDIGSTEKGERFIVSEYIDGTTLREKIGSLSIDEIIEISCQASSALASAHSAGVIHRDIKPENIMIRSDGIVKVLDFGIAKLAADSSDIRHLDPHIDAKNNNSMLLGTVNYMSPEQATGETADQRTDLFSLGVVMYEMLAGDVPFDGADLLDQIATKTPTPLSQFRKDAPPALHSIVERCLEKKREDRFASAAELTDALMSVNTGDNSIHSTSGNRIANYLMKNRKAGSGGSVRSLFGMRAIWGIGAIAVLVISLLVTNGLSYLTRPLAATPEVTSPEKQEPPPSSEAYQSYLRGKFLWNKRTGDDLKKAIAEFERAVALDPNFALAYVGLADCYSMLEFYVGMPAGEALPKAEAYAEKAVELDPTLGDAHATLGNIYYGMWQWDRAERELKRAIELKPGYEKTYQYYYLLLRDTGRSNEAIQQIQKARDLAPVSLVINVSYSRSFLLIKDYENCLTATRDLIGLYPQYSSNYVTLGYALLGQDKKDEAIAAFEKAVELERTGQTLSALGYASAITGNTSKAASLAKELEERYPLHQALGREIAAVYVGIGDHENAFAWLEKDFDSRSTELSTISYLPPFDPIRETPRFQDLLRRMGLPARSN
ncbi:MAG TPA: protein kinase [Pyrinomonadaceae bacterium]|nr:protein kinase [Pyrinomonadaceae bacterium]